MTKQMPDPYAVLRIPREATEQQVRDAYRRLAKRYHPDLHPEAQTSERMGRVNQAWHVLSDPARRARYDAEDPRVRSSTTGYPTSTSRRPGAPSATAGPGQPASAATASPTGPDPWATGWVGSAWTYRSGGEPRPRAAVESASGPPWLAVLAILAVGWLVVGAIFGGFLPLPGIGLIALLAAGLILGRSD